MFLTLKMKFISFSAKSGFGSQTIYDLLSDFCSSNKNIDWITGVVSGSGFRSIKIYLKFENIPNCQVFLVCFIVQFSKKKKREQSFTFLKPANILMKKCFKCH